MPVGRSTVDSNRMTSPSGHEGENGGETRKRSAVENDSVLQNGTLNAARCVFIRPAQWHKLPNCDIYFILFIIHLIIIALHGPLFLSCLVGPCSLHNLHNLLLRRLLLRHSECSYRTPSLPLLTFTFIFNELTY